VGGGGREKLGLSNSVLEQTAQTGKASTTSALQQHEEKEGSSVRETNNRSDHEKLSMEEVRSCRSRRPVRRQSGVLGALDKTAA